MRTTATLVILAALSTGCMSPARVTPGELKLTDQEHNRVLSRYAPEILRDNWRLLRQGCGSGYEGQAPVHDVIAMYVHHDGLGNRYRFILLEYALIDGIPTLIDLTRGYAKRRDPPHHFNEIHNFVYVPCVDDNVMRRMCSAPAGRRAPNKLPVSEPVPFRVPASEKGHE